MRIFPDIDGSSAISKWLSCGAIDGVTASTGERDTLQERESDIERLLRAPLKPTGYLSSSELLDTTSQATVSSQVGLIAVESRKSMVQSIHTTGWCVLR